MPELNLTGEQMNIKENIMKVVNFEKVIENLEEHIRKNSNSSQRLLFRPRPNVNFAAMDTFSTQESVRNMSREEGVSPKRKYMTRPQHKYKIDNSVLKQLTIKESLRGVRSFHTQVPQPHIFQIF